jgi:hypothetical protein
MGPKEYPMSAEAAGAIRNAAIAARIKMGVSRARAREPGRDVVIFMVVISGEFVESSLCTLHQEMPARGYNKLSRPANDSLCFAFKRRASASARPAAR